jgi:hypothetical protein
MTRNRILILATDWQRTVPIDAFQEPEPSLSQSHVCPGNGNQLRHMSIGIYEQILTNSGR